jgi:hypothetical protein
MAILTSCPGCQAPFSLGDYVAGKQVRCGAAGKGTILGSFAGKVPFWVLLRTEKA